MAFESGVNDGYPRPRPDAKAGSVPSTRRWAVGPNEGTDSLKSKKEMISGDPGITLSRSPPFWVSTTASIVASGENAGCSRLVSFAARTTESSPLVAITAPVVGSPSERYLEPAGLAGPPNTRYLPSGVRAMFPPNLFD